MFDLKQIFFSFTWTHDANFNDEKSRFVLYDDQNSVTVISIFKNIQTQLSEKLA
jgi:hypothetical protein